MTKYSSDKKDPFDRSQPLTRDFFNIPLIGEVRPNDGESVSGDYNLGELVANFPGQSSENVTLQVMDNALCHAGILKNDFLTVRVNATLKSGDFAVVKLGERIFVRKYYRQNGLVRLETADDYPSSVIVETNTPGFSIIGKVISITREF